MKKIIKNTSVILSVILILFGTIIIFKSKSLTKEDKYKEYKSKYESVIANLMNTKSIGVYISETIVNQETKKKFGPGIINNITDYEEVEYFINLIKDCPLITRELIGDFLLDSDKLYLYDENNNELLCIEAEKNSHIIAISNGKNSYYLDNIHITEINDFLEKHINYEF